MTVIHSCLMFLYCTSLVFHIWPNGSLYLLNLNALTRFLRLQTTNWEKGETCEKYLLDRNVSIDEAAVNCLTNTKTCSSSCKESINQMQFIVKCWNMIDEQNILQLPIPLNASRTDKDCTVLLQRYGSLCSYGTIFSLMQSQTKKKENSSRLNQLLSLKLVCNLKHLSCKQFHKIVKGDFTFLGNF